MCVSPSLTRTLRQSGSLSATFLNPLPQAHLLTPELTASPGSPPHTLRVPHAVTPLPKLPSLWVHPPNVSTPRCFPPCHLAFSLLGGPPRSSHVLPDDLDVRNPASLANNSSASPPSQQGWVRGRPAGAANCVFSTFPPRTGAWTPRGRGKLRIRHLRPEDGCVEAPRARQTVFSTFAPRTGAWTPRGRSKLRLKLKPCTVRLCPIPKPCPDAGPTERKGQVHPARNQSPDTRYVLSPERGQPGD